jgi:predicted AAA+ superfamily ATPase
LKPLKPIINRDEIFSQAVTDSMLQDEYEEDSFVNDVIEYESSTADELDFVQEHNELDMAKAKSNQKKTCQKTTLKKRKRIIISSSEDDEEIPSKLVETPPKHDEEIPSKLFETPTKPQPVAGNSLLGKMF